MSCSDIRGAVQRHEFANDTIVVDEFADGSHNGAADHMGGRDNRKTHAEVLTALLLRNFLHVIRRDALVSMDVLAVCHFVVAVRLDGR